MSIEPKAFPYKSHRKYGKYTYAGLWEWTNPSISMIMYKWKKKEFGTTKFLLSRELGLFYTQGFAEEVATEQPSLYCKVHNVSKESLLFKKLQAWRVKAKILKAREIYNGADQKCISRRKVGQGKVIDYPG